MKQMSLFSTLLFVVIALVTNAAAYEANRVKATCPGGVRLLT